MVTCTNTQIMYDLRDAVVKAAKVVGDNFGKDTGELGTEYKVQDGDTARTVIDRYAEDRMKEHLVPRYPDAVFNLEESEVGDTNLEGKLLIFGDPYDGTANAQPRLPLSTQGLMAAQDGRFIAAVALHPFERYVLYGVEGEGVFRSELTFDEQGEYFIVNDQRRLPSLEETFERLKSGEHIMMPFVDANYTPVNFVAQRKAKWKELFVETFDSEYGGPYNARMMREMGSNIDAGMKVAEGRLHAFLTDTIGGTYDVAFSAFAIPMLGGVVSDIHGNPLQVPRTSDEMKTPPQQVIIGSIHPEIHEGLVDITQKCYGEGSEIYVPSAREMVILPKYTGFKKWDPRNREVFESIRDL